MQSSNYRFSRRTVLTVIAGGAALVGGVTGILPLSAEPATDRGKVTLYKNPDCGCCEGYADYLRQNGFKVTAVPTNDLTVMGEKYSIPDNLQPCHISLIGGYVVGGHIPIEVVNRLLSGRSLASLCPVCQRALLGCPARSPARCRSSRSGRVHRRSMRPSNRCAGMQSGQRP